MENNESNPVTVKMSYEKYQNMRRTSIFVFAVMLVSVYCDDENMLYIKAYHLKNIAYKNNNSIDNIRKLFKGLVEEGYAKRLKRGSYMLNPYIFYKCDEGQRRELISSYNSILLNK